MISMSPNGSRAQGHFQAALRADVLLVAALIALDVVVRVLPHIPNFAPVAATALFAGTVLRTRALALLVPLLALLISDTIIGFDDWRLAVVTYAASTLPALVAFMPRGLRAPGMFVPVMLACSLIFFATTNFAVWAFSGMYPLNPEGLATSYVLALPFLQKTVIGDLCWASVLFGGAWLVRSLPARLHGAT